MGNMKAVVKNLIITCVFLGTSFIISLFINNRFEALVPAMFMLAVFLTSVFTRGYIWGIVSALVSVLAVNYAFTFPYFKFNFTIPENLISALIMIIVTLITCALTTKIKFQEMQKSEGEMERMRANLLRAVSHDLRTPLTTIYGSSSAMLENDNNFTEEQKVKMLRGIKEDAQWLTRMVENLLSVTKLDGGNVKIIKTPTVLEELTDSVLVKFKKRYPDSDVRVNIPDEFILVPMDALLIEQVIINILENAVQHAKGMTELSFTVSANDKKAIFEISDNGCGISPERLKTIFTGYSVDDNNPSDGKNNHGIGLSVCATIIKAHGGNITAGNQRSGGAVFRFSLEIQEDDNEQ